MTMEVLAFPFRWTPSGIATVAQFSDAWAAQAIAACLLTRRGELVMDPGFGIPDPTFRGVEQGEVASAVRPYYPEVEVGVVTITQDGGTAAVEVRFGVQS